MNKSSIILLFLFFSMFSYGQKFTKMVDNSNIWTIVKYYRTTKHNWSTYKIRLEKDSLSENQNYFKIIKTDILKEEVFEKNIGYIREDENGNVYFTKDREKELLLYSFNVMVGDTISTYNPLSYYHEQQKLIVDSIYEVMINHKQTRKIVLKPLCSVQRSTIWIEGIGDLKGLMNNTIPGIICTSDSIVGIKIGNANEQLSCFEKNQILIYRNPDFEQCNKIKSN